MSEEKVKEIHTPRSFSPNGCSGMTGAGSCPRFVIGEKSLTARSVSSSSDSDNEKYINSYRKKWIKRFTLSDDGKGHPTGTVFLAPPLD